VCADLEAIRAHVPHVAPIAIADSPPSMLVIAAFRTGAYDFIDLGAANKATVIQTLQRALRESHLRAERRIKLSELRALVDEFLRGLVKSEQRSLDLESQLRRATGEATAADSNDPEAPRPPRVLIVDDDQDVLDILEVDLQAAGAEVVLASSGEDALQKVSALGSDTPLDVLLIDGKMPGIDGLETIRRVRALRGAVPAMLMTGFSSAQSAINAADLGVVGYVVKPFDDIGELVGRVVAAGTRAVAERRERAYLLRIKHRHANLLFHYRKIAAQLERLE
jgi:DNA-binding NtrC family response regulator